MQKKMICIACPNGCHLTVRKTDDKIEVIGNKCSKGEEYGKAEVTNPKRTVTAVVKTNIKEMPYVSVRTDKPYPKGKINDLLKKLYTMEVSAPIKRGKVILENFDNTGVNVVCTKTQRNI